MIVKVLNNCRSITGIRIEASDARLCFPPGSRSIELELDHLRIQCELQVAFPQDRTEICDPRLCEWLDEQFFGLKPPKAPVCLEMVKAGSAYRLQLLPGQLHVKRIGFGLSV